MLKALCIPAQHNVLGIIVREEPLPRTGKSLFLERGRVASSNGEGWLPRTGKSLFPERGIPPLKIINN
jgi:hypothetical protein